MEPSFRDRQALKRLRKLEKSISLRIGEHITKSVLRPWRFPFLILTLPILVLRIFMERMNLLAPPDEKVEWERKEDVNGLLVYVDGFSETHIQEICQDLQDVCDLNKALPIVIVCTTKYQKHFTNCEFPVFSIPDKENLSLNNREEWGILLEEQLGGISAFFKPSIILIVGNYPHRALKNLLRSTPNISLILDQRPYSNKNKKVPNDFFTHLSGVLRERNDSSPVPPTNVPVYTVDSVGLPSWIVEFSKSVNPNNDNISDELENYAIELYTISKESNRDTTLISSHIENLISSEGFESAYAIIRSSILVCERLDESNGKKITRDLFVSSVRTIGKINLDYMLELTKWRQHRYQDERASKSIIQFLRDAKRYDEATPYLEYVKDIEWRHKHVKNMSSNLLAKYGRQEEQTMDLTSAIANGLRLRSFEEISTYFQYLCRTDTEQRDQFLLQFLLLTNPLSDKLIYEFLLKNCKITHNSKQCALELNHAFMMYNDPASAVEVLKLGPKSTHPNQLLKSKTILSKMNGSWLSSISNVPAPEKYVPKKSQILYLTHMSLPFESAGYCTRTHGLLTNLLKSNKHINVQNRFGYPLDKSKLKHLEIDDVKEEIIIDNLTYGFDRVEDKGIADPDEIGYINRSADQLMQHSLRIRPACIQAASNHVNGAIGLTVAKALKIPFIYEVRGLWHMSRVARQPHFLHHAEYQAMDLAEIEICNQADRVVAITHAVRHYLIEKGVDAEKIYVLPNGVDTQRFQRINPDGELKQKLRLTDEIVIGYVGSFVKYEGLDILIEAFAQLHNEHKNTFLLLVGDGENRKELEEQAEMLGISSNVHFSGRVEHNEVQSYHSIIDIAPFARTPDIVCEFISPLKPFESMAMGQVVVASNVAALSEIIKDFENGRLFKKGDSYSLYKVLEELVTDRDEMRRLSKAGESWVKENRDWGKLASHLYQIHQHLLEEGDQPDLLGNGKKLKIINGRVSTEISGKPTIMAIMDEFSTAALSPDANLILPTPENWQELIEEYEIDFLLVESAWEGNSKTWKRKVGWYSNEEFEDLQNLVSNCRKRNIPTIFYNKEDPVHFDRFSKTSAIFDCIFTTDENCISKYRANGSQINQHIESIQFAAQPFVHHPYNTGMKDRTGIAFAGTYYSGKYPDRCKMMDILFNASKNRDLIIYNRQSDDPTTTYIFPEMYSNCVQAKLSYEEMLDKHREHKIFLNVNSVENSTTMAARRIFEIPASGACLVSGPGIAMREVFGNIIPIIHTESEAEATISELVKDEQYLQHTIQASRGKVLRSHLNSHRLSKFLEATGFFQQAQSREKIWLQIQDDNKNFLEILLWLSRQSDDIKDVYICKKPTSNVDKLLEQMMVSRGYSFNYSDISSEFKRIEIQRIDELEINGLSMLYNELLSTEYNVRITNPQGDSIAYCFNEKNAEDVKLEHYRVPTMENLKISSIDKISIKRIPKTLLVAGHDLKFAEPIIEVFQDMGIEIIIDKWENHNKFDEERSKSLLEKADAIWCEWALGNVRWYSNHIKPGTPLFVRYHLQERNYNYLNESNQDKISNVSFVCRYYEKNAKDLGQIGPNLKTSVIPNTISKNNEHIGKNDNYCLGFVGMVPSRKRVDLAIDLLEQLLKKDPRYHLKIVGKRPEEYNWMLTREEEMQFYSKIYEKIESDPLLKEKVEFLGFVEDIDAFYSSVGHVISTSDFESFHLTLADGPNFGCAAHTLNWDGSDGIYTSLWLNKDINSMAEKIHHLNLTNKTNYHSLQQLHHLSPQMQTELIALSILSTFEGDE